jgi:hypothetical protein
MIKEELTSDTSMKQIGRGTVYGSIESRSWPRGIIRRPADLTDAGMAGAAAEHMDELFRQAQQDKSPS